MKLPSHPAHLIFVSRITFQSFHANACVKFSSDITCKDIKHLIMKKHPRIASNSPPSPGRSQHVSEMRLEQEHFVPAQTGHQTHYLYRHLSMPMHLWPVHLHRLTAASLQELRNQCLTSKHNMCSSRHEQPPHKINVLHVL